MLRTNPSKDCDDNDPSSSSYDSDECLAELLGGISMDGDLNWQEEETTSEHENSKNKNQAHNHGKVNLEVLQKQQQEQRKQQHEVDAMHAASLALKLGGSSSNSLDIRFQNAHGPVQENGSSCRPKVTICDMGSIQPNDDHDDTTQRTTEEGNDKGKGLVATDFIPKGSVIFTEKAAIASQVPLLSLSDDTQSTKMTMIQACQSCFRSLEPLSTLSPDLPCPELWPVLPLQWHANTSSTNYRSDAFGRIQCLDCQSLFCCKYCYEKEQRDMNGCCTVTKLLLLGSDQTVSFGMDQAPVVLAAKLFCHATQYLRRQGQNQEPPSLDGHFLWGLCGDASDLDALEIGIGTTNTVVKDELNSSLPTRTTSYSLDSLYQYVKTELRLTEMEQDTLSLEFLHLLASKTARNGFGIRTQSPFKQYYSGLLRKFGRDSSAHQSHMQQVAMVLSNGTKNQLERGMDRLIDEQVAPWITGIFVLTAHLNHSCEPNAMVVSQEFVDAHVDLVAKRDILAGEEILISYIQGVENQKSTHQRRRELEAKYLFTCGCRKCRFS